MIRQRKLTLTYRKAYQDRVYKNIFGSFLISTENHIKKFPALSKFLYARKLKQQSRLYHLHMRFESYILKRLKRRTVHSSYLKYPRGISRYEGTKIPFLPRIAMLRKIQNFGVNPKSYKYTKTRARNMMWFIKSYDYYRRVRWFPLYTCRDVRYVSMPFFYKYYNELEQRKLTTGICIGSKIASLSFLLLDDITNEIKIGTSIEEER